MARRLIHVELPAADTGRDRSFYESFCGWSSQRWEGPVEYHMADSEAPPAAIYARRSEEGPRWFESDDLGADSERVRGLGRRVSGRAAIPGVGLFALATDSEGNELGPMQGDPSAGAG